MFLSVSLPFIFYFVWFVFLVCLYYVYLYMGQVPELKLMMMPSYHGPTIEVCQMQLCLILSILLYKSYDENLGV